MNRVMTLENIEVEFCGMRFEVNFSGEGRVSTCLNHARQKRLLAKRYRLNILSYNALGLFKIDSSKLKYQNRE